MIVLPERVDVSDLVDRLWRELAALPMSVSHDQWHIKRVLAFAEQLWAIYGGERDVLVAAVLMHDLGRADERRPHGLSSIDASTELAAELLRRVAYPPDRAERVLIAIHEHDQPALRPSTVEGRILKDADFLAGVGAWGVLRIAMWSGESARRIDKVMERLEFGMTRRVEKLEFPESIDIARRELSFARLFAARLKEPPILPKRTSGLYLVLEGISGSGKDTQALRLAAELSRRGLDPIIVTEPSGVYQKYRAAWSHSREGERLSNSKVIKWLMMADRQQLISERVQPALEEGRFVLSVRSFLSTLVYQATSEAEEAEIAFEHAFVPQPDAVFVLDLPADEAWSRINKRDSDKGLHETVEQLAIHRERYLRLGPSLFGARCTVVQAGNPLDEITKRLTQDIDTVIAEKAAGFSPGRKTDRQA